MSLSHQGRAAGQKCYPKGYTPLSRAHACLHVGYKGEQLQSAHGKSAKALWWVGKRGWGGGRKQGCTTSTPDSCVQELQAEATGAHQAPSTSRQSTARVACKTCNSYTAHHNPVAMVPGCLKTYPGLFYKQGRGTNRLALWI